MVFKTLNIFLLICIFILVNNQVPKNRAINSCGKNGLGYTQPQTKEDCKDDNDLCCFVTSPKYGRKFCSFAVSEIDEEALKTIRTYTQDPELTIECNNSKYLYFHIFLIIIGLFSMF